MRLVAVAAALLAALAAAAASLPLLEVPGWEVGQLVALLFALALGPALGIRAARGARSSGGSVTAAALRAWLAALVLVAAPFAAAAGRAALGPCAPLHGAALYAVTAVPSALLAVALGLAAGTVARSARGAVLAYAAVAAASLASTIARAYLGPASFAHDHLFGFWPGPIYDEAQRVGRGLLLYRVATLAFTAAAVALATAASRSPRRPRGSPVAAVAAVLLVVAGALLHRGAIPSRAAIARELGGTRSGPLCTLHFPAEKPPAEADRLAAECERDAAAVARALHLSDPPRATVFLYRSPAEKARLVGAAYTSYTKPWLAEIHIHDAPAPHPVLRHELVHALASVAAPPPLRVPARGALLPSGGLVEGLAMAIDRPATDLHARARVLRDMGHLPPAATLMGDAGFFSAAPARAYVAAGSFVRFLMDTRGGAAVVAVYGDRDWRSAFGRTLTELEREWQRVLDDVRVPPALRRDAEERFRDPGLFGRRCARETARR